MHRARALRLVRPRASQSACPRRRSQAQLVRICSGSLHPPHRAASPRRASRAKEDDGSFEISELMRQVMDWKRMPLPLAIRRADSAKDRHQAECEAHQRTRERLRAVETELNALKGLPPPAPDPNEASSPKLTATITIKPLELPVSASPPSAPSSPTTTSSAANASPASAPTTPTGSSPNFFRTTGRQMGRLLAGGGSSSQRGERRLFGVRLEVVMASPSDVPRAVSQALGFVADARTQPTAPRPRPWPHTPALYACAPTHHTVTRRRRLRAPDPSREAQFGNSAYFAFFAISPMLRSDG